MFFKRVKFEKSKMVFPYPVNRKYYFSVIFNILTHFLGDKESIIDWTNKNSARILREYHSLISVYRRAVV